MRYAKLLFFVVVSVLMAGCVPSLNPLSTDENATFDPALLGTWVTEDGTTTVKAEKSGENAYNVAITENGKTDHFTAKLAKIGDSIFADLFPVRKEEDLSFYESHLVPAHTFYRVKLAGDSLEMSGINVDLLAEKMRSDKKLGAVAHAMVNDKPVLTADSAALAKFATTCVKEGLLADPLKFTRKDGKPEAKPTGTEESKTETGREKKGD